MKRYRIVRHYSDGRRRKTIRIVFDKRTAELHCNSPLTRGVLRSGVKWFDGFEEIQGGK